MRRTTPTVTSVALVCLALASSACGDDAATPPLEAELTLGTHDQGHWGPDAFTALDEDGAELPVVLGQQGLWMVVLALRTHELLADPFALEATLVVGSQQQGEVTADGQTLRREADGLDYYYDIWLVVPDPTIATFDGDVRVELEGSDGETFVLERRVSLTGGF